MKTWENRSIIIKQAYLPYSKGTLIQESIAILIPFTVTFEEAISWHTFGSAVVEIFKWYTPFLNGQFVAIAIGLSGTTIKKFNISAFKELLPLHIYVNVSSFFKNESSIMVCLRLAIIENSSSVNLFEHSAAVTPLWSERINTKLKFLSLMFK